MKYDIKGSTMGNISKEELRAILTASSSILEFHNYNLYESKNQITVVIKDDKYLDGKTKTGKNVVGRAYRKERKILLPSKRDFQQILTTVLHEMIHLYIPFDSSKNEKCASTLCSKLKPDVAEMYEVLADRVYQRSAYFAHTKISYPPEDEDYYDENQYNEIEVVEVGKKYRTKKSKEEEG